MAKAAEMGLVYNQLILAWNNLSLNLYQDISEPTLTTTTSQFLKNLNAKASIWHELVK